jgi:hypothetical protein
MNPLIRRPILVVTLVFFLCAGPARGDFIVSLYGSGTAENSWAYSSAVGVGKGNSTTYVPLLEEAHGRL